MAFRTPRPDGLTTPPNGAGDGNNPPASVLELRGHCFWGRWTLPEDLPNASGNAATGAAYACMRPGDFAYVETPIPGASRGAVFMLIDRGTDGGTDARWSLFEPRSTPELRLVTTPLGADFYTAPAGIAGGAKNFVLGIWYRLEGFTLPAPADMTCIAQNLQGGPGRGWRLTFNFPVLRFEAYDGANVFNGANFIGFADIDAVSGAAFKISSAIPTRDLLLLCRGFQSGGVFNVDGIVNGMRVAGPQAFANAGMAHSGGSMQIGGAFAGGNAMRGGLLGVAYYEGTITEAQAIEYSDQALGEANLIEAPWGWDNLWSAKDNEPKATWAPTIGVDALTRAGAPVNVRRYLRPA